MTCFAHIKPGDRVTRYLGGRVPYLVTVESVTPDLIVCDGATFNARTGMEVDASLGWDGVNTTGSTLYRAPNARAGDWTAGGPCFVLGAPEGQPQALQEDAASPDPLSFRGRDIEQPRLL